VSYLLENVNQLYGKRGATLKSTSLMLASGILAWAFTYVAYYASSYGMIIPVIFSASVFFANLYLVSSRTGLKAKAFAMFAIVTAIQVALVLMHG